MVWLLYVARHGMTDPVSCQALDMGGNRHRGMRPTLMAHVDHNIPFFPGHRGPETLGGATLAQALRFNATVQPWLLNRVVKAKRIGEILHIVHQSRAGACVLLRRLASAGLLAIDDDTIDVAESRVALLLPEVLKELRRNGTIERERGA